MIRVPQTWPFSKTHTGGDRKRDFQKGKGKLQKTEVGKSPQPEVPSRNPTGLKLHRELHALLPPLLYGLTPIPTR